MGSGRQYLYSIGQAISRRNEAGGGQARRLFCFCAKNRPSGGGIERVRVRENWHEHQRQEMNEANACVLDWRWPEIE